MQRYVSLKGKIEIAKRTVELRSVRQEKQSDQVLVHKDADSDVEMASDEEGSYGSESGEEEIKEIPIGKRARLDSYGDEAMSLDDDVSSSGSEDKAGLKGEQSDEVPDYDSEEAVDDLASSGSDVPVSESEMSDGDMIK